MAFTAGFAAVTFVSISEQRKREKRVNEAQKREQLVSSAERANQARKSRREQIREARIRQAEVENVAATTGQTGSSAAVVAEGSLQAQLATNVGQIGTALTFGSAKSKAQQDILDANRKKGTELFAGAALSIASVAGS